MTGVAKGSVRVEYGGEEVVGGGIAAYHKGQVLPNTCQYKCIKYGRTL